VGEVVSGGKREGESKKQKTVPRNEGTKMAEDHEGRLPEENGNGLLSTGEEGDPIFSFRKGQKGGNTFKSDRRVTVITPPLKKK